MKICFYLFLVFLFASCEQGLRSRQPTSENPLVELPNTEQPENPMNPTNPSNPSMEERYPFLLDAAFWDRIQSSKDIPRGKKCTNQNSYAYFGVARVAAKYIESDLAMFPFSAQNMRYYKFLDKVEPEKPKNFEVFGTDLLFEHLLEISEVFNDEFGRELTLTGITKHSDFDHDEHCRHRAGNTIDMRPWPGLVPVTWRSKEYNRAMNLLFIKNILADSSVSLVFFNDPEILKDKEIKSIIEERKKEGDPVVFQSASGHDNHIHIEFKLSDSIQEVSDYVFSKLGLNKSLKVNFAEEYRYH